MPINETNTQVHPYPMSSKGITLDKNILELEPEECLQSQNCVYTNGMEKRGGQTLITTTQVVNSSKILGLHRFYKGDGTKQLLAACDTTVKYFVSPSTWTNAVTGLTTGLQTYMTTWGPINKVFICNGTDEMKTWDGSASTSITISDGVPRQALPYQDRLLTIIGGNLTWSASFDATGASWQTIANCGVRPDTILYGMCYHSITNEQAGYTTAILLAGANGMYIFTGTDLRTPSTTGDYTIYALGIPCGCNAPRTMCWTPFGTVWLGVDKQIYMLPYSNVFVRSLTPIPIGGRLQSKHGGFSGIESISAENMKDACAVYHEGYYKLSVNIGGTTNNVQFWLDMYRLFHDPNAHTGPWYGPMTGQSISCFANQNGQGDDGELVGGEAQAYGNVYYLHADGTYGDIAPATQAAKAIPVVWQTLYHPLGNAAIRKDVHQMEIEAAASQGNVLVSFFDITGPLTSSAITLPFDSEVYWGDEDWGVSYFNSSSVPARQEIAITPAIHGRRVSVSVQHSMSSDLFQLFGLSIKATEQNLVFE